MKKLAGLLGVAAALAFTPLARADFEISVNNVDCLVPGVVPSPTATGSQTCSSVTVGTATITDLAVTGTQAAGVSLEEGTTLQINNLGGTSAVTFTIDLADTNFTSPTAPPFAITDASGLTINPTVGTGSATLTSCVDQDNGLVPPSGTFCGAPAPGQAGMNPGLSFIGAGTKSNTVFGTITALHAPFSLTQELTVTIGAGSEFNLTSSQVLTPTPEPVSIALMGGVLLLTSGAFLRKRKQEKPQA